MENPQLCFKNLLKVLKKFKINAIPAPQYLAYPKLKFDINTKKDLLNINKLVNDCLELLKNNYSSKFEGSNDISTRELTDFVTDIFTLTEYEFFQFKIQEYSVKLNNDDYMR